MSEEMIEIVKRPSPFVLLSTGHGTLIVNRNDYRLLPGGDGYGVGFQLFESSYFDPDEIQMALTILRIRRELHGDGVVGVDCGANLGVHTVEWAKAMYGWGSVIAIEAQERIYYALAGNIAINNCFNATALHAAVGAEVVDLNIPIPNYLQPASFGSLELKPRPNVEFIGQDVDYSIDNSQTIKQISIDSLCLDRFDFIKLDIEGMELDAIQGAAATIDHFHPVIYIEHIKVDQHRLYEILAANRYILFEIGDNTLAVHEQDPSRERIHAPQT